MLAVQFAEYSLLYCELEKVVIAVNEVCCRAYPCNIFCCTAGLMSGILASAMLGDSLIAEPRILYVAFGARRTSQCVYAEINCMAKRSVIKQITLLQIQAMFI